MSDENTYGWARWPDRMLYGVYNLYFEITEQALINTPVVALVRYPDENLVMHAEYVIGILKPTGVIFKHVSDNYGSYEYRHAKFNVSDYSDVCDDYGCKVVNLYGYARLEIPPEALIW